MSGLPCARVVTEIKEYVFGESFRTAVLLFALSRLLIVLAVTLLAPLAAGHAPAAAPSWENFLTYADAKWYLQIATEGYVYDPHLRTNMVFYPLFPLLCAALMKAGFSFTVAGVLVSNLSFLFALSFFHDWARSRFAPGTARLASALLAVSPVAVFATIPYTEGLFLLLSLLTLKHLDEDRLATAALFVALASITRPAGLTLLAAVGLIILIRRGVRALPLLALAGSAIVAYSAFCAIRFGDPVAYLTAAKVWRGTPGSLDLLLDWARMLFKAFLDVDSVKRQGLGITSVGHLATMVLLMLALWLVGRGDSSRAWLPRGLVLTLLLLGLYGIGKDELLRLTLLGVTVLSLLAFRRELAGPPAAFMGLNTLVIVSSGVSSVQRYFWGTVPFYPALALWCRKNRAHVVPVVGVHVYLMVEYAVRMSSGRFFS